MPIVIVDGVQYIPVEDAGQRVYAAEREEVLFDGALRERIGQIMLAPFKTFLVRGLVRNGVPEDVARRRLVELGDGTLLQMIFDNWDKILQVILMFFGIPMPGL